MAAKKDPYVEQIKLEWQQRSGGLAKTLGKYKKTKLDEALLNAWLNGPYGKPDPGADPDPYPVRASFERFRALARQKGEAVGLELDEGTWRKAAGDFLAGRFKRDRMLP